MKGLSVGLIALPWPNCYRPQPALGVLSAYIRRESPEIEIQCCYEYIKVSERLDELYDLISEGLPSYCGEICYVPLLYPEKRSSARVRFCDTHVRKTGSSHVSGKKLFDRIVSVLEKHLDFLADHLVNEFDVIGMTTGFSQIFANLALSKRVKERSNTIITILGGPLLSGLTGPSLLQAYPFLDYCIQGEGEKPLLDLLTAFQRGETSKLDGITGLLTRTNAQNYPSGVGHWEIEDIDSLPFPDYDEFFQQSGQRLVLRSIPIEGSRGCWWDRSGHTGDIRKKCHFCSLNAQWRRYRQKSLERLSDEIDALSTRYQATNLDFLDNSIRARGITRLGTLLNKHHRDYTLYCELRASVSPIEIVHLWEAGLQIAQVGIEGLSSSYLKRLNKGTTTIQNLQAMKTCFELGIDNGGNMLLDFPGATEDEIKETCDNIRKFALCYQPLSCSFFSLQTGSTVAEMGRDFGISAIRNSDTFRGVIPDEIYNSLHFWSLSYDSIKAQQSWTPVLEAIHDWFLLHLQLSLQSESKLLDQAVSNNLTEYAINCKGDAADLIATIEQLNLKLAQTRQNRKPLYYKDGGSFITIVDNRHLWETGKSLTMTFPGIYRDIYLFCAQIRTLTRIQKRFELCFDGDHQPLNDFLATLVSVQFMFREGDRFLALAVAPSPQSAAEHIKKNNREK